MSFSGRYTNLNDAQKMAVDTIDGPLMVVAGPGTGKTELLSMRAANILRSTDVLPQNILCLTFTESGAAAMRTRLFDIIGKDAYKVAVHTFHSFGQEVINQNSEFFYRGAQFQPASDLKQHEILETIFSQLGYDSPLAGMMNDQYTYLKSAQQVISELKRSGLTSDELLAVLGDNERILDSCEKELAEIFGQKISKQTKDALIPIANKIAELPEQKLPPGIAPLRNILALSLSHAYDEAESTNSTKPITAWRNNWLEKNGSGTFVFKDRKRTSKLRALAHIYFSYLSTMQTEQLYDFDDMVLNVVHALEVIDELRFNLQEQYQYVMVDEFQDTNLAQSRLLHSLTNNPVNEGSPNIMVVGDDDQAIYSFQGAELSNIMEFKNKFESTRLVTLVENYRSTSDVLDKSRQLIVQGTERLERYYPELNKTLHSNLTRDTSTVNLEEFNTIHDEYYWIAKDIKKRIDAGTTPNDITVIARRHHELVSLLPYFADQDVSVNYERRENVLEIESVHNLMLLARITHHLALNEHSDADALLPELLAHPMWNIEPTTLWKLSVAASRERHTWMEQLSETEEFKPLHSWLSSLAAKSYQTPIEPLLDELTGLPSDQDEPVFISPLYDYYFGDSKRKLDSDGYLTHLNALRTIRDKLRDHSSMERVFLAEFIEFIDLQDAIGSAMVSIHGQSESDDTRVNLMTAHKSKGLEFEYVYVTGAVDSAWGERVRPQPRLISYPSNLPFAPVGDTVDERMRLMYVAMTRAKSHLFVCYSQASKTATQTMVASYLSDIWEPVSHSDDTHTEQDLITQARLDWQPPIRTQSPELSALLKPTLERYKLSATHLNAFIDITRCGPEWFVLHNLLRFPQAMSPNAAYGSAIHRTLQQAHAHMSATKKQRPIEDILHDFETSLESFGLSTADFDHFLKRGSDYLQLFLQKNYDDFNPSQQPELNFSDQQVILGEARLTGSLDLVEFDKEAKTIAITDYKTGKASRSWIGKDDNEKVKLHKYRQQLLFYALMVKHSRNYSIYEPASLALQYVEPTSDGDFITLEAVVEPEELERFEALIAAVWKRITTLDLPDISDYPKTYKGVLAFEEYLLTNS